MPLDPAHASPLQLPRPETVAGAPEVRRALRRARRVYVSAADQEIPQRLTKAKAREMLARAAAGGPAPVVVTARFLGPDLVIRTLEFLGDPSRLVRPGAGGGGSGGGSSSGGDPSS